MRLIIGLGNPGRKYQKTRHNIGFIIANRLSLIANRFSRWKFSKKLEAEIAKNKNIILAKPQTFMNESGRAVVKIKKYYKIKPQDIWVIHDDKDLELGKIRIKQDGSSAGHNGVQSIIDYLGAKDFWRIRIGVGQKEIKDTTRFILSNFNKKEEKKLALIIEKVIEIIKANQLKTPTTLLV